MDGATASMHPLSLHFADRELEQAFRAARAREMLVPFRVACVVLFVVVAIGWAVLPWVVPNATDPRQDYAYPILGILVVMALGFARSFLVQSFLRRQHQVMVAGGSMVTVALVAICAQFSPGWLDAAGLLMIATHIINCYAIFQMRFPWACVVGWGTAVTYLGYLVSIGALAHSPASAHVGGLVAANLFGMLASYLADRGARREFLALRLLGEERERSEQLLLNILPAAIAERLKASSGAIADRSAEVTVLFADIVGFTPLSARLPPEALVQLLDRTFSAFDALADRHGLEKIKTIGDAYMAAAGIPEARVDHAPAAARMAIEMLDAVARVAEETGEQLAVRIGLHSGPVVAGVIGKRKFSYDLWGDTVNTASRMESHGIAGDVQVSDATARLLGGGFRLEERGLVEIDGKGELRTFLLRGVVPAPTRMTHTEE